MKKYFKKEYTEEEYIEHIKNIGTMLLIATIWMIIWSL